jgi:parallel beta-helix repeat protein
MKKTRFGAILLAALACALPSFGFAFGLETTPSASIVDVRQYGADQTGKKNSTAYIAAAIADASAKGLETVFPCGTYLIDNVSIPSGARLRAAVPGCATLKRPASATGHYVASAVSVHDFSIEGLVFDANGANNSAVAGSGLWLSGAYSYNINGIKTLGARSLDVANFGVGLEIDACADLANSTSSRVTGSTFLGGSASTLTGLLIQRCQNLTVSGNAATGNAYGGIALTDQTLPAPASPTNVNIVFFNNRLSSNGVGLDVAGFTSGPGIGGAPIWSQTSFVNQNITVTGNEIHSNLSYGGVFQAADLTVIGNTMTGNGTNQTYGGAVVSATRCTVAGNTINGNSYYGLDIGGSSNCEISGNTIRQNGNTIGQGIGFNLGAVTNVHIGANDVGDNGGAGGGFEVLGSALDGSGNGNFYPWVGSGLTIDGLRITISNSAMAGVKLFNGWSNVAIPNVTIDNTIGSAHPYNVLVAGTELRAGNTNVRGVGSFVNYVPQVVSASTIVIPDYASIVEITGNTTINTIYGSGQSELLGGLLQLAAVTPGAHYTASATIVCTSSGGTPATGGAAAVSTNGGIYGYYVNSATPGSGASAMSCTAADQTCTASPGSATLSGGALVSVGAGSGGSGCTNPPDVVISGLSCTNNPRAHATVAAGAVTGYVIDYGGSGCTGSPAASIANGSGFSATTVLNQFQDDHDVTLRFDSNAVVKNATGNVFLSGGDFTASATGGSSLRLRSGFGNAYGN